MMIGIMLILWCVSMLITARDLVDGTKELRADYGLATTYCFALAMVAFAPVWAGARMYIWWRDR